MANSIEPSSSLSFTSSSHLSNGSISHNQSSFSAPEKGVNLEVFSLNKLSSSLEQLLIDSTCEYSDAEIIVEGIPVCVHRCILAARSKFFYELFKREKGSVDKEGKPKYPMSELLPYGKVGYEAFLIFLSYTYSGKLKPFPMEVSTCVDNICVHDACRPAINFAVEMLYASSIFELPELVSLFQVRMPSSFWLQFTFHKQIYLLNQYMPLVWSLGTAFWINLFLMQTEKMNTIKYFFLQVTIIRSSVCFCSLSTSV